MCLCVCVRYKFSISEVMKSVCTNILCKLSRMSAVIILQVLIAICTHMALGVVGISLASSSENAVFENLFNGEYGPS